MHLIEQVVVKNWPVLVSLEVNKLENIKKKLVIFIASSFCYSTHNLLSYINTLRTGDSDLRFYITTVQDG